MLKKFLWCQDLSSGSIIIAIYSAIMMPFCLENRLVNDETYTTHSAIPIPEKYVILGFVVLFIAGILKKEIKLILGWSAFSVYYIIAALYFIVMDSMYISDYTNATQPIIILTIRVFDLLLQAYFWICTYSFYIEISSEPQGNNKVVKPIPKSLDVESMQMVKLSPLPTPRYNPPVKLARAESVSSIRESYGYQNKSVIDNSKMNDNLRQQVSGRVGKLKEQFSVDAKSPTPPFKPTSPMKKAPVPVPPPKTIEQDEDEELYLEFD